MWKLLFQSVRGAAHEAGGQPCQDSCLARLRRGDAGAVLVLAASDGAGSAPLAHVGAAAACAGVVGLVLADLAEGLAVAAVDRDTAVSWLVRLRRLLRDRADQHGASPDDLACTLLLAVVGEGASAFAQVGDGAIVVRGADDVYRPVFWPQSGEYANTTNFVTGEGAADLLDFRADAVPTDELALLTDGVQGLALTYADRAAHQPFFRPLFARLRSARTGEGLALALRRFLGSPPVCARSDDDKTLVLATRAPARDGANAP
jgi:hypothetical protein